MTANIPTTISATNTPAQPEFDEEPTLNEEELRLFFDEDGNLSTVCVLEERLR